MRVKVYKVLRHGLSEFPHLGSALTWSEPRKRSEGLPPFDWEITASEVYSYG